MPTFGYWNVRGLATPIRLLLHYAGVQYDEKLYKCGPPPDFDRSEWLKDKESLDIHFPNLPYYIDGNVKITQSSAIIRYLAKKYGLMGKTDADQAIVDQLSEQVRDYHMDYARIVYNPDFKNLKVNYAKDLVEKMKKISKFMGNKKYVVGDYLTYADFILFEYLEGQLYFDKDILKDLPNLEHFHKRILALEAVDSYFKSPNAIKFPFNGAPALFGGQYSDQM